MLRKTMVPSPAESSSPLRTLKFFETTETTVKQKYHIPKNWILSNRAPEYKITHTHTVLLTAWSILE
jgi:hypothetical protein